MVKIYVKGNARSVKVKSGLYVVLLEYKEHKKVISGEKYDTTKNELELCAVLESLKTLTSKGKTKALTIITENHYIERGINENVKKWHQNEWRNSKGVEIKNKNLWQEIWEDYMRINPLIKAEIGKHEKLEALIEGEGYEN